MPIRMIQCLFSFSLSLSPVNADGGTVNKSKQLKGIPRQWYKIGIYRDNNQLSDNN